MIVTRTLEEAMRVAAAMRQLRDVEMAEARRWRDVCGRASDERAREFIQRHIGMYVAAARKWNRQLVLAMRAIRQALYLRQVGRPLPRAMVRQ